MKPRAFELDEKWTGVAKDVYVKRVFGYDFLLDMRDEIFGQVVTEDGDEQFKTLFKYDVPGKDGRPMQSSEILEYAIAAHFAQLKEHNMFSDFEKPYVAISIGAFVDKAPKWKRYLRKILQKKVLQVAHESLHSTRRDFALAGVEVLFFNPVKDVSLDDQYSLNLTGIRKVPFNDVKGTFWDADDILWTFGDVEEYLEALRDED